MRYYKVKKMFTKKQMQDDFYKSIVKSLNKKIPKKLAQMLIKENNDPNYVILMHRSSRVTANQLFQNGL